MYRINQSVFLAAAIFNHNYMPLTSWLNHFLNSMAEFALFFWKIESNSETNWPLVLDYVETKQETEIY